MNSDWINTDSHAPRWVLPALALLVLFHLAVNAWWIATDNRPSTGDDAVHRTFVQSIYEPLLYEEAPLTWRVKLMLTEPTGIYPPLFHILSAVTAYPFGGTRAAFLLFNTLLFGLLIASMYRLARCFFSPTGALVAVALCSFFPMIAGISRLFLTDLFACLIVIWAIHALHNTATFRHRGWCVILGILNGIGFWVRWITCIYFIVPTIMVFITGLVLASRQNRDRAPEIRRVLFNGAIVIMLSLAIPAPWYASHMEILTSTYNDYFKVMDAPYRFETSLPQDALPDPQTETPQYLAANVLGPGTLWSTFMGADESSGAPGLASPSVWTTYALLLINKGVFLPLFLLSMTGFALSFKLARKRPAWRLAIAWFAGAYLALTLMWFVRNPAPRYILPLLPPLALFTTLALAHLKAGGPRSMGALATFALALFHFSHITFLGNAIPALQLPLFTQHAYVRGYDDAGLVISRGTVNASGAKIAPPYTGLNWVDEVFRDMTAEELTRPSAGRHAAGIALIGANQAAIEVEQRHHWPLRHPLSDDPRHSWEGIDRFLEISESLSVIQRVEGMELRWATPLPVAALRIVGAPRNEPCNVLAWNQEKNDFDTVSPTPGWARFNGEYDFLSFTPVNTNRILLPSIKNAGADAFQVFVEHPQTRPLHLAAHGARLSDLKEGVLEQMDYVIATHALTTQERDSLEREFTLLRQFDAPLWGYWEPSTITLFARKADPVLSLDTTPGLDIHLTAGETLQGRWDLPWWRYGPRTAPNWTEADGDAWVIAPGTEIEVTTPTLQNIRAIHIVLDSPQEATIKAWRQESPNAPWQELPQNRIITNNNDKTLTPKHPPLPTLSQRIRIEGPGESIAIRAIRVYTDH